MNHDIEIVLTRESAHYEPEEPVEGMLHLRDEDDEVIEAVEITLAWVTSGPGDVDEGVAALVRKGAADLEPLQASRLQTSFSLKLPSYPLSYQGELLGVAWHLRVEVFPALASRTIPIVVGRAAPPIAW